MKLFNRKKPWVTLQHEEEILSKNYSERGVKTGAKLEDSMVANVDINRIFTMARGKGVEEINAWLDSHREEFDSRTFIVNTDDGNVFDSVKGHQAELIINEMALNRIRHLNTFMNKANEVLIDDG